MEKSNRHENRKNEQLEQFRTDDQNQALTTNQGLKVSNDEFSLKAGVRGPTLMEDFHFREKMTHFDHERIPERVVHARGYAAHGEFEAYGTAEPFTKAGFLKKGTKTPVFVRFSTVVGSRGSAETVRDTRGFSTKFYTEEGNYDLVANNMPVFFIQDAIKFPDLVHAIKPEPHNEMPQAAAAHNTFWDFVAHNTESAHHVIWNMADRAIPRSFRMMEGFGVHTFRFINDEGKSHFVKFHWKPKLGVHSLVWDEAQKISGKDPDFNRKDLWESIEAGDFPEYEFGVQLLPEEDEFKFDFDVLDPTKLWPEEDVPVTMIGKMTLNRNVDNVFAETEQVAFHPGHVVPGIDFTNDPLLQGRLFSYTDTQLIRLGGPNFHEIPINRPVCPFHNNQRDGYNRQTINKGRVSYHPNSLANNTPAPASPAEGGYEHYQEKVEGRKVRARSESFNDHFSQAKLFWNSMSATEKQHIVEAYSFELGKCDMPIREMNIEVLANVDLELAQKVAGNIGVTPPAEGGSDVTKSSPALSQENTVKLPDTRKVGVLIDNGFDGKEIMPVLNELEASKMKYEIISETQGKVTGADGTELEVTHTFSTTDAVLYDALYAVGGPDVSKAFAKNAAKFLGEAFDHYKAIGAAQEGEKWLEAAKMLDQPGIVTTGQTTDFTKQFIEAVSAHRHWDRDVS
ncbi:catalase [Planomicrobium soli]|uniref:Catalase n=1 Tax=Planomicrobium soli TaxID=1176648 RepID=A0A2P8GQT0_9BACL|nr:catalase [Planomicrobium soli]PSL36320.1 catalase [Planomicrobium soli]